MGKLMMMMDKFSLSWNDFQDNVKQLFGHLREEEDFSDVTLVSDDGKHINTHKIILSASSVYFKEMLKKANHAHPMIILHGFLYKDSKLIMDYIYQGEVQLYENEINYFLSVAQKLKIEGL